MFGVRPGLGSIRAVCSKLGNPQDAVNVIHVAGTNGKGATCALIESSLRAAGLSTGRYTSPHLVSLSERFLLNGSPVAGHILDEVFAAMPEMGGLTYFELLTAVAFQLYQREKVEWLVLETGLGGRLDATNVVEKPKLCVITRIGLDHCDWLGRTLEDIAREKGGIIKDGVPVVLGEMPKEARKVLEQIASEHNAPCYYAPEEMTEMDIPKDMSLKGKFNRENALTALTALKVLNVDKESVARGFSSVVWNGRFQKIDKGGKSYIVDGAHNPPAMQALVDAIKEEVAQRRFHCASAICGFCGDKVVSANLKLLGEVVDSAIAVPIRNPRSLPADETASLMRKAGFLDVKSCATLEEALSICSDGTVVCGSLFLAGEALEAFGVVDPCKGRFIPNESFVAGKNGI